MPTRKLNLPTSSIPRIPRMPGDEPAVPTLTPPPTPEHPAADPVELNSDPGAIEYASWMRLRWPCAA